MDIITLFDGLPLDSVAGSRYVATGYVFPGYVTESPSSGTNIQMQIITGKTNLGSQRKKSVGNLKVICNKTTNSNNVLVQHTDEVNNNYNAGRNIDISNLNNKLTRMGSFITRNHKLTTSPDEQVRIEGIEIDA